MNTSVVKDNWSELKAKLKKKFPELTDQDLVFAEGKKEEMMGRLEVKLGKNKEELQRILDSLK